MATEIKAENAGDGVNNSSLPNASGSPVQTDKASTNDTNTTAETVRAIKKEEGTGGSASKRTSPVPPASSGSSIRSHPPPIMTNSVPNNRPPSTTSVQSSSSTGARSTTAMSRRGGRTRSRSPPMMIQRPPSANGPPQPESYQPAGSGEDRGPPPSPANPSAAAAAAAAAAKSISRNPPPPGSWYDSPDAVRERDFRRSRGGAEGVPAGGSRYHGRYYEGGPPPTSTSSRHNNWPPEEQGPGGRPPSSRDRYPPRRQGEEYYGYREGYSYRSSGGGARGVRGEPYPPPYDEEYERRGYPPEHRYGERGPRTTSPRPPSGSNNGYDYRAREHRQHREDPYYRHQNKDMESRHDAGGGHTTVKRTTRVIGTATPIHMTRAPEQAPPRGRTPSGSIFRGRPGADVVRKAPAEKEGDNSQKILMSLRTPSTSFEEKTKDTTTKRGGDPLSPEAPPQIQHSHHQSATDSNLFFEPQRSPKSVAGPPQQTNSLDMAPSFTLFNQSFDSIGDTANFFSVSGPLDSTLQSTSFGAALAASDTLTGSEEKSGDLQLSASNGNFSQQILGGSSSGGAMTFGMSPSNSFGNGPSSSRGSNMMVLGGQDNRSASPSQVLDMYRSYSGGATKSGGPAEDSHLRMNGSMGGQSLSHAYTKSFNDAPHGHYRSSGMSSHPDSSDGTPGFYLYLKRHKGAFQECSFLLPGLKSALLQAPDVKQEHEETPKRHTRSGNLYGEPNPHEIVIARRRVASAVCAFGGTFVGDRASSTTAPQPPKSASNQSIFREKPEDAATVTPNSSTSSSPGGARSRQRARYDEMLPGRYYENDNRLSWEFEENPPIEESGKGGDEAEDSKKEEEDEEGGDKAKGTDGEKESEKDDDDEGEDGKKTAGGSKDSDQPKMRYRCKLCGQPKQNHTCPYQQSLARSIGTMVYPAVNAFTSAEPGSLAPALSEMNNFILSGAESVSSTEASPSRPTPDRLRRMNNGIPPTTAQVTPESLRGVPRTGTSPVSTPQRGSRTPGSAHRGPHGRRYLGGPPSVSSSASRRNPKKRSHRRMMNGEANDQGDLLFVDAIDLKPEQFRMVTPSKTVSSPDAFTYPALPLPYAQRKRLSDNLFSLSKEVPQLTDECAAVLREAREKDMWDLAVAELMTQVVVVVHCHDGDSRFEGLRRYLLTLGISC